MSDHVFRLAAAAAIVTSLVVFPSIGAAQPAPENETEASERFQKGVELYEAGDVRAALIEFKRAHKLAPTFHLLFNIGQAATELREYVEAHTNFERYLREGGDEINDERRSMVEKEIARLETYLARLTLKVAVEKAEISVDGVLVGTSPLVKPLLLSAGRRALSVSRPGYSTWERSIDLAGEDELSLDVELVSLQPQSPSPAASAAPVQVRRRRSTGMGAGFWVSAVATVAFGAGTGVAAVMTTRSERDYEDELKKVPNTQAVIDDAASKYKRNALLTDIGIGLTAVAAISTLAFAIRSAGGDDYVEEDAATASIEIGVSPSGVVVGGRF